MHSFEDEEKKGLSDPSQPYSDNDKTPAPLITGASQLRGEQKIPPRGKLRHRPPGAVVGEFLYIGDKPVGVEPGFLAVEINMNLLSILETAGVITRKLPEYKDPLTSVEKSEVIAFLKKEMDSLHTQIDMTRLEAEEPESKVTPITKILKDTDIDPEKVDRLKKLETALHKVKQSCIDPKTPKESRISLWLIKQDYNKGKPYPPDDRISSTTAVKMAMIPSLALKVYRADKQRKASFENESMNAILENLANDIAGLAMKVQEQKLYLRAGDKESDSDQFVTVCRWEPQLEMFTGCLAGSTSDNKYYIDLKRDADNKIIKGRDLQILAEIPAADQQKANQYYFVRKDMTQPWRLYRTNNINQLSEIKIDDMPQLKSIIDKDYSTALPFSLTMEEEVAIERQIDDSLRERQKEKDNLIEKARVFDLEVLSELPPEAKRKPNTFYLVKGSLDQPWELHRVDNARKSHVIKSKEIEKLSAYLAQHTTPPQDLPATEIAIIQKDVANLLYANEEKQLKLIKKQYGEDYYRGPIPIKDENGFFSADKKLPLGEFAPLMLLLADNDSIGSNGQNKGQVNGELFGLDFGHAFRGKSKKLGFGKDHTKNPLLDHMRDDFSFDDPKFKNIGSLFYDSALSERMQGMFMLYKLMGDDNRKKIFSEEIMEKINAAIELYEKKYPTTFKEKYSRVKDGGLPDVFKQYKDKMQELIDTTKDAKQQVQYKKYLDRVATAEKFTFNSFKQMAEKLEHRISLRPDEVDLLNNMEKLTSKTSIASENGTVLLNHMRVDNPAKNRVKWQMQPVNEKGFVNFDCNASPGRAQELKAILYEYINQARAQIKKEMAELQSNQQHLSPEKFIEQAKILAEKEQHYLMDFNVHIGTTKTGQVYIGCHQTHLAELCEIFQEDRIKHLKPKIAPTLDVTPDAVKQKLPEYTGLPQTKANTSDLPSPAPVKSQESKLSQTDSSTEIKAPKKSWSTASLFSLFKIKRKTDYAIKQIEPTTPSPEKTSPIVNKTPQPKQTNDPSFAIEESKDSLPISRPRRGGNSHTA